MPALDKEIDRILTLLRNKIRERGFTQLQVQDKLSWGRSYISQLLTKQKSLRVEQVMLILDTIGVEPREFYAELYQLPRAEAYVHNIDEYVEPHFPEDMRLLTERAGGSPAEGRSLADLRSLVYGLVQLLAKKGVFALQEVSEAAQEADPESPPV